MSEQPLALWGGTSVHAWRDAWAVPLLEVYARIASTSDRALALAAAGCDPFSVVIADEQTEGRGRRGARWHSARGAGLWMSLVLPSSRAPQHLPLRVGLAVAEGIEEAARGLTVGIEWPNDIVTAGGKVGGVLCESAADGVVAGIGVNLRTPDGGFPAALAGRATSLQVQGANSLSRSALAGMIVSHLKRRLSGDAPVLDPELLGELSRRDALRGRTVVTEGRGPGTARGIDRDGALILERPDGSRVPVVAGSVRPL